MARCSFSLFPTASRLVIATIVCALLIGASLKCASLLVAAERPMVPTSATEQLLAEAAGEENGGAKDEPLVREGEVVENIAGHFRRMGERILFQPAKGGRPWPVLENLSLERVARTIQDTGKLNSPWTVSGVVTEYRGANYLLLSRAMIKTAPAARRPADAPQSSI